jgi:hypothetical protein
MARKKHIPVSNIKITYMVGSRRQHGDMFDGLQEEQHEHGQGKKRGETKGRE